MEIKEKKICDLFDYKGILHIFIEFEDGTLCRANDKTKIIIIHKKPF